MLSCPKTLLVQSKPTAKILSPGALNSWHQLQKQPHSWPWWMPYMAVANTCFAQCLNYITPFQPTAGPQSLATQLSHTVKTLQMCHCSSCDLLEMQRAWLLFLELWFLSLNFVTTLKILSRTDTCLAGFSWKGKIVLLASLKHLSAVVLARNPNQYCCLPCCLVPGNILVCPVLCLGITSILSKPTHCVFVLMCMSSRMLVSGWKLSPVCIVIQLAGGEGSHAPYSFCRSSQCCSVQEFSAVLHLTKLFSVWTSYLLFYRSLSEQSLPSSSCEPYVCCCFSSSCPAFASFLILTFSVLIRQLVMVMFCQLAGWPRGICREMLEPTLNMYLLFLLVFCWFFSPFCLKS